MWKRVLFHTLHCVCAAAAPPPHVYIYLIYYFIYLKANWMAGEINTQESEILEQMFVVLGFQVPGSWSLFSYFLQKKQKRKGLLYLRHCFWPGLSRNSSKKKLKINQNGSTYTSAVFWKFSAKMQFLCLPIHLPASGSFFPRKWQNKWLAGRAGGLSGGSKVHQRERKKEEKIESRCCKSCRELFSVQK